MAQINWNQGQLITMAPGDTAICSGALNQGQIYGLFFYNSAQNDASTVVTVVGSNSQLPVTLTVPGTTANQGLAAICFVYGGDTSSVTASIGQGQPGGKITAFICSVKMPTNTSGISNMQLPMNGQPQSFNYFNRFYCVPASNWYQAQITSNIKQFMCVQFVESQATVYIVNPIVSPSTNIAYYADAASYVKTQSASPSTPQTITWNLQGNGSQYVFMNADSPQDSQSATIEMQSLG